jgi:hypothetical protein
VADRPRLHHQQGALGPQHRRQGIDHQEGAEALPKDVRIEAIEHQGGENDSTGATDEVRQAAVQRQRRAQPHQHEGLDQQAADHEQRDRHTRRLDLQEDGPRHGGECEAGKSLDDGAQEHRRHEDDLESIERHHWIPPRTCRSPTVIWRAEQITQGVGTNV